MFVLKHATVGITILSCIGGLLLGSLHAPTMAYAQEPIEGKIAYLGSDKNIWIVNADGSEKKQLTTDGDIVWDFSWSPDGRQIAFLRLPGGIYVIDADGSNLRQLVSLPPDHPPQAVIAEPAWSPDGRHIAFIHQRPYEQPFGSLCMVDSDGSNWVTLSLEGCNYGSPAWSPDGTQIVCAVWFCGFGPYEDGLYIIDYVSKDMRMLVAEYFHWASSWSPGGGKIAFTSGEWDEDRTIYVINSDGTGLTRLRKGDCPSWSPDGSQIAFSADGFVWIMDSDGSHPYKVTEGFCPAWQPRPRFSIAQTLEEKRDNIAYLQHPPVDILGLVTVPVPFEGYDESAASRLVEQLAADQSRYDAFELGIEEQAAFERQAHAFARLKLSEDALQEIYPLVVQMANHSVDKNVDLLFSAISFLTVLRGPVEAVLTAALGEQVAQLIIIKTEKTLIDLLNAVWEWRELQLPDQDARLVSRNLREGLWKVIKARLELASDKPDYLDIFQTFFKEPAKFGLVLWAVHNYIGRTQGIIDRGVARVEGARDLAFFAEHVKGNDSEAEAGVSEIIRQAQAETERAHQSYQGYKRQANVQEIIGKVSELAGLMSSSPLRKVLLLVGDFLHLMRGFVEMFTGDQVQTHFFRLHDHVFEAESHAFDPAGSVSTAPSPGRISAHMLWSVQPSPSLLPVTYIAGFSPMERYLLNRRAALQASSDTYQTLLQRVLQAVERGDKAAIEDLLPDLLAADDALTTELKLSRAPVLAAAGVTEREDLAEKYQDLLIAHSAFSLESLSLYWQLLDNLANPDDHAARQRTREQADAVLASIGTYQQRLDAVLPAVAEVKAPPLVLIASYSVPDEIISGQTFELAAKVANAGIESASDISVRVVGGEIVYAEQTVALGEIAGTEEKVVTFQLQAGKSGTEILTLDVLKGDEVLSTQLVCASVVEKPVGDMLTPSVAEEPVGGALTPSVVEEPVGGALAPKESRPQRLPIPCFGLGITSVMVLLLIWLQLVRPTTSS